MKTLLLTSMVLMLAACAKEKDKEAIPDPTIYHAPQPTIANIPYDCKVFTEPDLNLHLGAHEFPGLGVKLAAPFDCGWREGKHCFYFLHITSAGVPVQDVRCE